MAPLSPRKLPLSPCLTPPPVGLSPRGACSCNKRCPVHLVSVNEMDQRSLNGNTPPPSLVTDSDADSNKENVPIYPAVNIAAAASHPKISCLRHQLSSMSLTQTYDSGCTYPVSDGDPSDIDSNANASQRSAYVDDECPATPMRLSGVVNANERTADQPPPPDVSPVHIVVNGRDADGELVCGAFDSADLVARVTQNFPGQIHKVYPVFLDGWNVWQDGWERGIFRARVHPASIWRPVVSRDEVRRRIDERERSIVDAVPIVDSPARNKLIWPALPIAHGDGGRQDNDTDKDDDEGAYIVTFVVIKGHAPGIWYHDKQYTWARGRHVRAESCVLYGERVAISYFRAHLGSVEVLR